MKRIIGFSIAIGVSIGVAMGLLFAHTSLPVSVGIAVIAILVGSAIARGWFGSNCEAPGANDE